jgi:hypothetical protein
MAQTVLDNPTTISSNAKDACIFGVPMVALY